jgi:hypothetical protein
MSDQNLGWYRVCGAIRYEPPANALVVLKINALQMKLSQRARVLH